MQWLQAFIAGFLATLVFHQGAFGLFYLAGVIPSAPFNMTPVSPFGVPSILSISFFGGLWGLPVWWLIRNREKIGYWLLAILAGAVGPTVVAMVVVFPIKGLDVSAKIWIGGLILNAV